MNSPTFPEVLVVGMHFRETEEYSAKAIVGSFLPPVELDLEREPMNPYDGYAIKVLYQNQHIGYIERKQAMFIAPWIDQGKEYGCRVDELRAVKKNLHPVVTVYPK
jgi:HIRAN domain